MGHCSLSLQAAGIYLTNVRGSSPSMRDEADTAAYAQHIAKLWWFLAYLQPAVTGETKRKKTNSIPSTVCSCPTGYLPQAHSPF